MEIEFIQIGIVGVVLTFIIEGIKSKFGPNTLTTKVITVSLAAVLGTFYFLASDASWWPSFLGILASATTFYGLFLKSNS